MDARTCKNSRFILGVRGIILQKVYNTAKLSDWLMCVCNKEATNGAASGTMGGATTRTYKYSGVLRI